MNWEGSAPPNVIRPLGVETCEAGANVKPKTLAVIWPWSYALLNSVGMM